MIQLDTLAGVLHPSRPILQPEDGRSRQLPAQTTEQDIKDERSCKLGPSFGSWYVYRIDVCAGLVCPKHRCTLCHANAIITPASYPGLLLRQAELEVLQERMPIAAFLLSDYEAELMNTRVALRPYVLAEPEKAAAMLANYKDEIRTGKRRTPEMSSHADREVIWASVEVAM